MESGSARTEAPAGSRSDPYRELFERSADAILIIEGETFIDCNQATVEMLRYRDKWQLLKTHPSQLSPETQPDGRRSFEKANEMISIAFERGSHRFEWDHLRADGEVFPVEVLLTAVPQEDQRILHVVWRDITSRKRLESELRHAQKMEAIGKLAGGVAHDFNNLLMAIVGNADLLQLTLQDAQALGYVDQIQMAAARAAELVRQLLAFSRKQELVEQPIDLNVLIARIRSLLARLIGEDIQFETMFVEDQLWILADPGQIEQVLMNLVANARDAMPDGGALTITARLVDANEPPIGEPELLQGGYHALISVTDSGVGMSEATLRRACDPFFTTKEVGKGTGLGLATAYAIVQRARGQISIQSVEGVGTTMKVYFPIHGAAADVLGLPAGANSDPGGSETILLVEDETAVASLLHGALSRKGYQVLSAPNGRDALELYLKHEGKIDLIVTDVIMPEISGPRLIDIIHAAGHAPRVLFISGYTDAELSRLKHLDRGVDLLRKPFHASDLTRRVRLALDRPLRR